MPKLSDNQLIPFVHEGELLTPASALRIALRVKPDSLARAAQALALALESVRRATAGMAVPMARTIHPTGTIIDQDVD